MSTVNATSNIEPGNVETPIWEKGLIKFNEMLSRAEDETSQLYLSLNNNLIKYSQNHNGISHDKVAILIHQILIFKKQKNRYLLGKDAMMFKLINFLPDIMRDRVILRLMKI